MSSWTLESSWGQTLIKQLHKQKYSSNKRYKKYTVLREVLMGEQTGELITREMTGVELYQKNQ